MQRPFQILAVFVGTSLCVLSQAGANETARSEPRGSVVNNRGVNNRQLPDARKPAEARRETAPEAVAKEEPRPEAEPQPVTEETPEAAATRTHERIEATEEEKQRAAAAQQAAHLEEQQMQARVRGLQTMIEREETLLTQRLTQAAQIREAGLTKNDQKLLEQAEQIERQALTHYQRRVEQFEKLSLPTSPSRSGQQATPAARPNPRANPSASPNPGGGR